MIGTGIIIYFQWKNKTILYKAGEGVWPTLSLVDVKGGVRRVILQGKEEEIVFGNPHRAKTSDLYTMVCSSPSNPADIYIWKEGGNFKRTDCQE